MKKTIDTECRTSNSFHLSKISLASFKKGHVLIEVSAAGVNFPDSLLVEGLYQMKPDLPFIPGSEVAGVIKEVGEDVAHLKIGQKVIGLCMLGGYAQEVLVPATHVLPIPDQIPLDEAAGLVTAHATAHHGLKQRASIKKGETLLVTGAAGGTGLAAVQIGKEMGATVIAVCSTKEKCNVALANGADHAINYTEQDLKETVKTLTNKKGILTQNPKAPKEQFSRDLKSKIRY